MRCDNNSASWGIEEEFWRIFRGGQDMEFRPDKPKYYNERKLDESGVEGFAYYASSYGPVAIFRLTDTLIPYSYSFRDPQTRQFPPENQMKYCLNSEANFDNANNVVDAFRRTRKEYPNTNFTEKTLCGFSLVKAGNKYNYISSVDGKKLSPVNFDYATSFNPFTKTATFGVNTGTEYGTFEFMVTSERFGRDLQFKYRTIVDGEKSEWDDTNYAEFLETMEELAAMKQGNLNESVDEVFTHKDFDTFNKSINDSRNIILYTATSPEVAKSIFERGPNREFSGTNPRDNSLYYGLGVYCVRDKDSIYCGKYGQGGVVKFILKDGFKDFIIFDKELRMKYDNGCSVYDEIQRLVPKDVIDKIDHHVRHNDKIDWHIQNDFIKNGVGAFKDIKAVHGDHATLGYIHNTAVYAKAFIVALLGEKIGDKYAPKVRDERLLSQTNIRGLVFTGGVDGHVALVRDFNSVMPIDYSIDGGNTWMVETGRAKRTKENFDYINQNADPYFLYRKKYGDVNFRSRAIGNFSLVNGRNGCNWMDIWFHRPLLPVDADTANNFDPLSKSSEFTYGNYRFKITVDDDMNSRIWYFDDDGLEELDYDSFVEAIQMMIEQGVIPKNRQFNNNCLLNPAVQKNK
jgi:hypothetical protein